MTPRHIAHHARRLRSLAQQRYTITRRDHIPCPDCGRECLQLMWHRMLPRARTVVTVCHRCGSWTEATA